jgi:hypothetical protein
MVAMQRSSIFGAAGILFCGLTAGTAHAGHVVVGVNIYNEHWLSRADQNAELEHIGEGGAKTIRTGLVGYNVDFIISAYRRGRYAIFRCGALTPAGKLALSPM